MTQPVGNYSPYLLLEQGSTTPMYVDANGVRVPLATAASTLLTQTKFVSKGGNDATGDGSISKPFLTIQAAITSITDATSAKQYTIQVAPGTYTTGFTMIPYVFIKGMEINSVILSPVQANWIGAAFAGASTLITGIENCTIGTALAVNFATVVSTGAGIFRLVNVLLDTAAALTITGASASNIAQIKNVSRIGSTAALTHTFANIAAWVEDFFYLSDNLTLTSNLAATLTMRMMNVGGGTGNWVINATGATATFQVLMLGNTAFNVVGGLTLTGDFVSVRGNGINRQLTGPDANTSFDFNSNLAGSTKLVGGGFNLITANPTADRTYAFPNAPSLQGTRVRLKNISATFFINLSFVGNSGFPTYVPPNGYLDLFYDSTSSTWCMQPPIQYGQTALSNGVSAFIPADIIQPGSRIVATIAIHSGVQGAGGVSAKTADRVAGTRAGGGGFVLTAVDLAGATVATDSGTYDWHVAN